MVIRIISDTVRFLYDDVKHDIKVLVALTQGKARLDYDPNEKFTWYEVLKTYWPMYLLLIAAFLVGYFISAKHWQDVCNVYIQDNFLNDTTQQVVNNIFAGLNLS